MARFAGALYALAITAWAGALWAVGYIAAPVLFRMLDDRMLAGALAGRMFALVAWLGIGCAAYLLVYLSWRHGARAVRTGVFWLVAAMLALTLAGHFGVQPILAQLKAEGWPRAVMESAVRARFAAWHGVASVLYLIQSVLAALLVIAQGRAR